MKPKEKKKFITKEEEPEQLVFTYLSYPPLNFLSQNGQIVQNVISRNKKSVT